jgi:hypothetical protein
MKYVIVMILALVFSSLVSTTLVVNQDGQSQFTTIQSAIIASAHGDTVLVYPCSQFGTDCRESRL